MVFEVWGVRVSLRSLPLFSPGMEVGFGKELAREGAIIDYCV